MQAPLGEKTLDVAHLLSPTSVQSTVVQTKKSLSLIVATAAAVAATAATTTATTTPSAAVTAASAGARGPFTRFVDRDGTAIDFGAIEGLNRPLAGIIGFHFHKPETA